MPRIGYGLSSEEFGPAELVAQARLAEQVGFDFAMISDHYHPWTHRQGQSPFVWTVLGGIASVTERLRVGTGVTCPIMRTHPAIIAQAAATTAAAFGSDRFFLGVGSGEALNEHILGDPWPDPVTRIAMLEEAIELMRLMWEGESVVFEGSYYSVDRARIFTRPTRPPDILVAVSGKTSVRLAADSGDGLVGLTTESGLVERYRHEGGQGPCYGQLHVCYGPDEVEARKLARELWPNSGLRGSLNAELRSPELVEAATELVREEDLSSIVCGPDPEAYLDAIHSYAEAGYDHVWIHQIGPRQQEFARFAESAILPEIA
jgi:coenzyme F420-dependent glucose-6-phosphate dehydrogenase